MTRLLPGAVATKLLLDAGFEVVKVEEPGAGDYMREWAPRLFSLLNGGKKSVAVDLKSGEGRALFLELAKEADVVIEGFRPGVVERLGVAYEDVRRANPRIAYVSLRGYRAASKRARMPGHDLNYAAVAGALARPEPLPVQVADIGGGIMAALKALELYVRGGGYAEVAMADVAALFSVVNVAGELPQLRGSTFYNVLRARDGYVAVGALEEKFADGLCEALGLAAECAERLPEAVAERAVEELAEIAEARDLPITPVAELGRPIEEYAELPIREAGRAPARGENTVELLGPIAERLGLSLDRLLERGVVEKGSV